MADNFDFKKFLNKANQTWGETVEKSRESNFEDMPDGRYFVQLSKAELKTSKGGRPMVQMGFKVLEGEQAGNVKNDFIMLDGDRGLEPLAWRLGALGVPLEDIDLNELDSVLDGLVEQNMSLAIVLKTTKGKTGDFQNLRIDKLLPDYQGDGESAGGDSDLQSSENLSDEGEAGSEGEVDLQVGMKVSFEDSKGKSLTGSVTAIDEDAEEAKVKVGVKTHTVAFDALEVIDEGTDG